MYKVLDSGLLLYRGQIISLLMRNNTPTGKQSALFTVTNTKSRCMCVCVYAPPDDKADKSLSVPVSMKQRL